MGGDRNGRLWRKDSWTVVCHTEVPKGVSTKSRCNDRAVTGETWLRKSKREGSGERDGRSSITDCTTHDIRGTPEDPERSRVVHQLRTVTSNSFAYSSRLDRIIFILIPPFIIFRIHTLLF